MSMVRRAIDGEMQAQNYLAQRKLALANYKAGVDAAVTSLVSRSGGTGLNAGDQMFGLLRSDRGIGFRGRGGYSLGRNWRKSGLGKTVAGAARDLITRGVSGSGMYTGHGAYTTNSLIGDGVADEVPMVSSVADETGAVTVSRREYIADIYAPSTQFNVQSYSLNPGLEATFPWLSQIAQNYDEYEFEQIIFTFKSTTTDIGSSTTGQCGTVIMATNYNASAPPFQDKIVMLEYDGASSCKATESMLHGVECDPDKLSGSPGKYVRANPILVNQDAKDFDQGLFQLAVANAPSGFANNTIGELWVSYTVKLRKPKFFVSRGLGISRDIYVSGGSETLTLPFGAADLLLMGQQNNIGTKFDTQLNPKLTFPAAYAGNVRIMISMEAGGTVLVGAFSSLTLTGNVATISDMYGAQVTQGGDLPAYFVGGPVNAYNSGYTIVYHFRIQPATGGIDNSIQFNNNFSAGTIVQSYLEIGEYNAGFSYAAQGMGSSQAPVLVRVSNTSQIIVPA